MTVVAPERQQAPAPYTAARATHGGALSLGHMTPHDAWMFCESLAETPLLPDAYRKQPASVLWAMEYGRALGLDVVTTITTIHVIKGKPTQSADLMLGRARGAGHRVRIKSERTRCVVTIVRADDPDDVNEIEWTLDDAVTARLCELRDGRPYARDQKNQPTSWEKYPRAMLRSRAIAECVRAACPEVLHGAIYTAEELGAVVDQSGNAVEVEVDRPAPQVIPHTVQEPTAPSRDYLAEAVAAADTEQLAAIIGDAAEDGAPAHYLAELETLRTAHAAPDVESVREMHKQAKAAGAPADRLARLAAIGATKPGAKPQTAEAATTPTAEQVEHDQDQDQEHAAVEAEQRLRLAASRANLPTLDADFERVYGLPIEQATAAQLDKFRARIETVASGRDQ
ncbi:recombinase RecT [Streptomyces sp. NBC_01718]|uniref:recombinase RecT n=1 Tax=Streptomyces sp. NBC_01718 TaxID=2975919 RepID=UPI00352BFF3D